jgi:hypothetical protein
MPFLEYLSIGARQTLWRNGAQSAYPFFAYEEHQPFADTVLPAKMAQGPEVEPAAP